ncbi:MAG: GNAT family N-acetyltransferase [Elusimicrobiota bacterium]|nr:GNAT family N-acetyltransferase [Elusimicrobiota bacterium]
MKNGNDNEIVVSAALRKAGEIWRAFSGNGLSRASTTGFKKRMTGLIEKAGKEAFVSLSVKNGRVRWFWVSKVVPDDFHGRIILAAPFLADAAAIRSGALDRICAEARRFHSASRLKIQIRLAQSDKKLIPALVSRGFRVNMYLLSGLISDSLGCLRGLPALPAGLKLRKIDMGREHGAYLRLLVRAHKSESTSTMCHMSPARIRAVFNKHKKNDRRRVSYAIYDRSKLAGAVTISIEKYTRKTGLLVTIAILPEYQGLGLSKHLYRAALLWLKAGGVCRYVGSTSTTAVMDMARKMRRSVASTALMQG